MRIKTIGEINNQILDENPFISKRLLIEERTKILLEQSPKPKSYKRNPASGTPKGGKRGLVKAGHIKLNKELNKPSPQKPDKHHFLKKIFGSDIEIKELSYTDKATKYWANKRRGA